MEEKNLHLDTLHDIKQMMERSSRFISLSGLSGIGAGICALGGAFFTYRMIAAEKAKGMDYKRIIEFETGNDISQRLLLIGAVTFCAAFMVAFAFTYMRSVKTGASVWSTTSRRLLWNTLIPLVIGGIVTIRLIQWGLGGLIAPTCLLFYGLALINGSKYTLSEIRWLGFSQLALGVINLWMTGYGLMFWAFGFGVLHIIYGAVMWWKYEKK
ncbi:MAG TPA: hypothetical protein VFE54_09385 [Mucilaginibacter sp.]|nr:hypothetical protein [Mucilaginibacter sp.]